MSEQQQSRTVLLTGASRGIGRAIAKTLAEQGFTIAINYRGNREAAEETLALVEAAGAQGYLLPFDVSAREETRQTLLADVAQRGIYWGVVLNAGVTADGPLPAIKGEEWDRVINTNLGGFYNVLNPLVMPMIRAKRGGRIVTMSSLSGLVGNRGQTNYAASKAGLIAATRSLAKELAKRQITVNSVAPGLIETDMTREIPAEVARTIPMRRFGKPEEVAGLVGFLFTPSAGYITGEVISVNGGML